MAFRFALTGYHPLPGFIRSLDRLSLWLCLLALAGCSGISVLNALTPGSGYTRQAGIVFDEHTGLQLDVYAPSGARNAPVAVFFYGGSWQEGAREDYRFVGEALARQGLVVVVPDYRLYPAVRYPAFLQDAAQAVAWTRSHIATYGGDPESLVLMGHSACAYNAAMLTLDPDFLQAVGVQRGVIRGMVGLAGPYDFLPLKEPALQRIFAPAGDLRLTQP
ncbi:MAG: alpha/beta hydrolase, partial [Candidatus Macondimonas sp.]